MWYDEPHLLRQKHVTSVANNVRREPTKYQQTQRSTTSATQTFRTRTFKMNTKFKNKTKYITVTKHHLTTIKVTTQVYMTQSRRKRAQYHVFEMTSINTFPPHHRGRTAHPHKKWTANKMQSRAKQATCQANIKHITQNPKGRIKNKTKKHAGSQARH